MIQTAADNEPRFDYSSGSRALLMEPAATNLLTYSEAFDNAAWTKAGTIVTANAATGARWALHRPADTKTLVTGTHLIFQIITKATSSNSYAMTVYLKTTG